VCVSVCVSVCVRATVTDLQEIYVCVRVCEYVRALLSPTFKSHRHSGPGLVIE